MGTPAPKPIVHYTVLGLLLTVYLMVCISTQWGVFGTTYSILEYERRYSQSQYVLGENKTEVMGDGDIYTYAGIRYIQGEDPTKVNFEHPPLSKYLFGLSYMVTGRPNWILVPLFFIAGFSFWFLAGKISDSYTIRWLAIALFLAHSTIYATIFRTMLDFPMMTFLLMTTAAYVRLYEKPGVKKTILWGISGGLMLSAQYPVPLLISYVGIQAIILFFKKVPYKHIVVGLCLAVVTYLTTYTSFFIHGHSLIDLVKFEWWRLHWFMGKVAAPKGLLWQTVFTGKYHRWWEPGEMYTIASHWNIFWPISILFYFISWIKTQVKHSLFAYKVWIIIALIGFSMGVAEDRFLIPLIPGFALFGASVIEAIYERIQA